MSNHPEQNAELSAEAKEQTQEHGLQFNTQVLKTQPKIAHFADAWRSGKPNTREGESNEQFEYKAGLAAIAEIGHYGELCRTEEGDLFFTTTDLPWKLVPLVKDDPRFIALMDGVFHIRASSKKAFEVILCSLQLEAFNKGKTIQVRQFCHADHIKKIVYLSLCDGHRMLKLSGTDENSWDMLPIVANGTDGVYFIDDPVWEAWYPIWTRYYVSDPETEMQTEFHEYDRTVAKRLLIDGIKFRDDVLTVEEQRWLMEKILITLLIDLPEKPLLAFIGDNGSGKTFVGETIKTTFLGNRAGRAENISTAESLRVSLTSNPLVIVDNLDDVDKKQAAWLVKDISTACTGTTIPLRRYYTTNQKVVLEPRSWIITTSTNTGFVNNSPALGDRVIIFTLDRMTKGAFRERAELMRPILQNRDAILSDLALRLNDYVATWKRSTLRQTEFRVASFGLTVERMAEADDELPKAKEIFAKIAAKQSAVITDNHWLIEAIDRFILAGNGTYRATGEDLLQTAKEAGYNGLTINKIHAEIEAIRRLLAERYDFAVTWPGNRKTYTFRKKGTKPEGGENADAILQDPSSPSAKDAITTQAETRLGS